MEQYCNDWIERANLRARIYCARPSGEEFFVALAGAFTKDDEAAFAENLRARIAASPLPDDVEWQTLGKDKLPPGTALPHASERRITVSLGVSAVRGQVEPAEIENVVKNLKSRADIALYRAKAFGRNKVVSFADILTKHGRVLEHIDGTDVVAIDIGRQVNVAIGQEFNVFHPILTGMEAFFHHDGRTQRRLGTYPKVAAGQIEVFDVQTDISFCNVLTTGSEKPFVVGSVLEAIPVGSIAHLVKKESLTSSAVAPLNDLEKLVGDMAANGNLPAALVVSVTNANALAESHGTAFVNRVLACLFDKLKSWLPMGSQIGQIPPMQVAAVIPEPWNEQTESVRDMLVSIERRFNSTPKITGAFCTQSSVARAQHSQTDWTIKASAVLDLARFALVSAESQDERVGEFTNLVPTRVLFKSREERDLGQALIDHKKFLELGIDSADLDNQLALLYHQIRDFPNARLSILRALEKEPMERVLILNAGLISAANKDYAEMLSYYRRSKELYPEAELEHVYVERYAVSMYRAIKGGFQEVDRTEANYLLAQAVDIAKGASNDALAKRYSEAIEKMKEMTV